MLHDPDKVPDLLEEISIEIIPKYRDRIPLLREKLKQGTRVFIAFINAADTDAQLETAIALRQAGFEPVPHLPARFIKDRDDLARRLENFVNQAGLRELLILAGGIAQPLGIYKSSLELLESGLFNQFGIEKIGVAGHPEGNPLLNAHDEPQASWQALQIKQEWLRAHHMNGFILTQFLFSAEPLVRWLAQFNDYKIKLPVHIGVAGPANVRTLLKYAQVCGIGNSTKILTTQAKGITKLLTTTTPDRLLADLAKIYHPLSTQQKIASVHFYPFGGYDKLFSWLEARFKTES